MSNRPRRTVKHTELESRFQGSKLIPPTPRKRALGLQVQGSEHNSGVGVELYEGLTQQWEGQVHRRRPARVSVAVGKGRCLLKANPLPAFGSATCHISHLVLMGLLIRTPSRWQIEMTLSLGHGVPGEVEGLQ